MTVVYLPNPKTNPGASLDAGITTSIVDLPINEDNSTSNSPNSESNTQLNATTTAEVASATTLAVTSGTVGVAAVANVVSSTTAASRVGTGAAGGASSSGSPQSLWAMINLYQEILLIPMLGTYLGNDFHYYVTEFELALFDFEFLKFTPVPVFEFGPSIIDELDFDQPDELFANNHFESGSAFYNCFQLLKVMFFWFILDMIFLVFR